MQFRRNRKTIYKNRRQKQLKSCSASDTIQSKYFFGGHLFILQERGIEFFASFAPLSLLYWQTTEDKEL
jgi:hypothetical protein